MKLNAQVVQTALVLSLASANVAFANCSKLCGFEGATGAGTREGCGSVCFWVTCNYGLVDCQGQYGSYWYMNDDCSNPIPCFFL